ncbi:MAG: GGDEF domain-containing protein [Burkholderiaceae bacterium]|nr:GGDEF domain-containing protein [Rhodoferax sp.]MCP5284246.1 GGDEF domain-containing protein [Burkholderiaceae bacterium]
MSPWADTWTRLWADDALAAFRDRIAVQLSLFSAVLLLPFTLNHFLAGRDLLGLGILTAQVLLAVNGYCLKRERPLVVPFWVTVLGFESAIIAAVLIQGVHSAVWAFPALFICYFVLPRRQAHLFGLFLLVCVSAAMLHIAGPADAVRMFAGMALTLAMINVVLGVIGELQQALLRQAHTDPLTGAWNRRYFDAQLASIAGLDATGRVTNALLALDIDHFKAINDRHGHATGDAVLQAVVTLVRQRKRETDLLFRIGGEEFVLLLPRTRLEDAARVAEDLRQRFEAQDLVPGVRVTVSMGLSAQHVASDPQAWLAAADAALYEAKRGGRNRVVTARA